jgi:hypothetical protein
MSPVRLRNAYRLTRKPQTIVSQGWHLPRSGVSSTSLRRIQSQALGRTSEVPKSLYQPARRNHGFAESFPGGSQEGP